MLTELRVRDFAIIDDLQLQFHRGFNVLTGETGAGKSIIIDAIELLLGMRASQDVVRAGAELASVEGIFDLEGTVGAAVQQRLSEEGLEGDDHTVILAREVRRGGRSFARINGRAVTQALLAEIGGLLVDIHGQGQHLSLLSVRTHLYLLDGFGGIDAARIQVSALVTALRTVRNELDALRRDERELARRLDLLRYQVDEIDAAGLTPGEDDALESERRRLANAETLATRVATLYELLGGANADSPSALDLVGEAAAHLGKLERIDPELGELHGQAEDIFERLSDLTRGVQAYQDTVLYDPDRLVEVEERLDLLYRLKRKYGDTIADIAAFGERARAELQILERSEVRTVELESEENRLLHAIGKTASTLSQRRNDAAALLGKAVEQELHELQMGGTRFEVSIAQRGDDAGCYVENRRLAFDGTGIDQVEFLVSANPGEPLRPLARVASGGETARLMLALKNVLSRADETPTLIFDEIDQGIGGRVGAVVGRKLFRLTQQHQVLCVTHLAQIAACADYHLAVQKGAENGRTVTRVQALTGNERVREVAALLGTTSESGLQSAQELLADEDALKQAQRGF